MKTRSKAQRVAEEEEAAEPLPLDKLAPEILNIIAEALAADEDILIPRYVGSLARSCKVIKEAVKDAKDKLKVEYMAARALVVKCNDSQVRLLVEEIVEYLVEQRPICLNWQNRGLTAADAPTLTKVLKSKAMERVEWLYLRNNHLGEEGAAAIAAAAADGGVPRVKNLELARTQIGDAGMQALASAFADGAFRELQTLHIAKNAIGDAGIIAFAAAIENNALPCLDFIILDSNNISAEGPKALIAAAGAGGLPKLRRLDFEENELSIEGIEAIAEALAEAIDNCALPRFKALWVPEEHENNPRLLAFTVSRNVCVNADPASDDEESSGDEVESDE